MSVVEIWRDVRVDLCRFRVVGWVGIGDGFIPVFLTCVVDMQCISLIDLQKWCFELGIVMMTWFCSSVERIHVKWWSRLAVWESSMWMAFPLLKVIYLSLRCFNDSDWILKIWNADSHYLFPSKPFTEPHMMREWAPWVDVVRVVRRNRRKDGATIVICWGWWIRRLWRLWDNWRRAVETILKSSDVYSWERDEVSTASDCDVILVVECLWKIHIGETGHV